MQPDPDSSFSRDERFIITLNKVTTMVYLAAVIYVGSVTDHTWAMILAVASLGVIAIAELLFLAIKQGAIELLRTQIAFALASWVLGLLAGVFLL